MGYRTNVATMPVTKRARSVAKLHGNPYNRARPASPELLFTKFN